MVRAYRHLLALLVLSCVLFAQGPRITKIEPPNWWSNLPHTPMLLLTGENFQNAQVRVRYPHLRVTRSQASANGHYLFIFLDEATGLKPGTAHFTVRNASGTTSFDFKFDPRTPLAGRAQGVNTADAIYLLMPDRFADGDPSNDDPATARGHYNRSEPHAYHGGDLKGVTDHLKYLDDLGVTALWLTPWWKNDGNSADYHGYHVTDFYAVEDHFGTMQDLQQMVAGAHARHMKVLMDYIVNHIGPNHPWANDPPTPTWLHGTPQAHIQPLYNFWPLVDPHATPADRAPVLDGWFADKLPDLNCDDPKLAAFLNDNAIWWMETAGLDGFRLDTFPYSSRTFWSQWHKVLFGVYPHTFTIGEVSDADPAVVSFFQGGRKQYDAIDSGVTSVFDFPSMYAIRDTLLRGASATRLRGILAEDELYPRPADLITFIGNHDNKRFMGETGASLAKLNAAASLMITMRGIPQIYSGDEIAMPGDNDPDNRRDFPGGFPGDARDAFTAAGRTQEQQEAYAHLQRMLSMHQHHKALQGGDQTDLLATDKAFAYLRTSGDDRLLMVLNSTADPQSIEIPTAETPLANARVLTGIDSASPAEIANGTIKATVAPFTVAIYQVR